MRLHISLAALLGLSACGVTGLGEVTCSSDSAQEVTRALIKENVEKVVQNKYNENNDNGQSISTAKIRATIAQLKIELGQIRTSKEDPNSSQKFCLAAVAITFPASIIKDANEANEIISYSSVQELSDRHELDQRANTFSSQIAYNVQPTDDKSEIFVEIEDSQIGIFDFAADVLSSHLLRTRYAAQEAQQRAEQQQRQEEEGRIAKEQASANLRAAKAELVLAEKQVNAVWSSLPNDRREELLGVQRAWIRKKSADCQAEAAASATDPMVSGHDTNEKQVAQAQCETRYNQERVGWLQQFQTYEFE